MLHHLVVLKMILIEKDLSKILRLCVKIKIADKFSSVKVRKDKKKPRFCYWIEAIINNIELGQINTRNM